MVEAILKASRSLIRDFGEIENLQVSRKGPQGFVSAADIRSEQTLVEELKKSRPTYGFLTEESGVIPGSDPEHRWIIDPLDGTNNFIHGIPHFSISIALEKAGVIMAGVTYNPILDELFWAEKGAGTFMNNRRLRVSGRRELDVALVASSNHLASKNSSSPSWGEKLKEVSSQVAGVRRLGATTLDLAYVAAGRLDGAWDSHCHLWDMAAGILMVQEAGGYVCDLEGNPNMTQTHSILAANDSLFPLFKSKLT
jgi:myo-inositol-1(or 4)-monophosphatase